MAAVAYSSRQVDQCLLPFQSPYFVGFKGRAREEYFVSAVRSNTDIRDGIHRAMHKMCESFEQPFILLFPKLRLIYRPLVPRFTGKQSERAANQTWHVTFAGAIELEALRRGKEKQGRPPRTHALSLASVCSAPRSPTLLAPLAPARSNACPVHTCSQHLSLPYFFSIILQLPWAVATSP